MNNIFLDFFHEITLRYNLGNNIIYNEKLYGGFLHDVYRFDTEISSYVVKILNENLIYANFSNYNKAEQLEKMIENIIPIISAKVFNGNKMQNIDDKYFYLFDYFPGRSIDGFNVNEYHAMQISKILANLHNIDYVNKSFIRGNSNLFQSNEKFEFKDTDLEILLTNHHSVLANIEKQSNSAIDSIPIGLSICHNDMDCKNVLWYYDNCKIIDLECLSYSSPMIEFYNTLLYWSKFEILNIDYNLVKKFSHNYFSIYNRKLNLDKFRFVQDCSTLDKFDWLKHNIEKYKIYNQENYNSTKEQIIKTIKEILYHENIKDKVYDIILSSLS